MIDAEASNDLVKAHDLKALWEIRNYTWDMEMRSSWFMSERFM